MVENRGRKSSAELSIVRIEPDLRPKPPPDLPADQANEFRSIVNKMPNGWFGVESVGILSAYCRHSANAKLIAKEIEAFRPDWLKSDGGLNRYGQLAKIADREHRAMATLATKMRLTQSSRSKPPANILAKHLPAGEIQPWDFTAEPADASDTADAS